jgi:hypothetical protein
MNIKYISLFSLLCVVGIVRPMNEDTKSLQGNWSKAYSIKSQAGESLEEKVRRAVKNLILLQNTDPNLEVQGRLNMLLAGRSLEEFNKDPLGLNKAHQDRLNDLPRDSKL